MAPWEYIVNALDLDSKSREGLLEEVMLGGGKDSTLTIIGEREKRWTRISVHGGNKRQEPVWNVDSILQPWKGRGSAREDIG